MGLIPQVKCGRCDRSYSGLRSRCPYCGAHRNKKGKRVSDGDNATWKLVIGILLIVVLIAAVVVILVTSLGQKDQNNPTGDDGPNINHGDGVNTKPGDDNNDGENPNGGENPDGENPDGENPDGQNPDDQNPDDQNPDGEGNPDDQNPDDQNPDGGEDKPPIASGLQVKSRYANPVTEFTVQINESQEVTAIITPSNVTSVPVWSSSDESIVAVVAKDETGIKATVTGVAKGTVTITCTVDGISYSFLVRCNGKVMK